MKGSDLKPGYSYVLGVYNSEYVRLAPYDFTVSVSGQRVVCVGMCVCGGGGIPIPK